jgi:hypothetical protein
VRSRVTIGRRELVACLATMPFVFGCATLQTRDQGTADAVEALLQSAILAPSLTLLEPALRAHFGSREELQNTLHEILFEERSSIASFGVGAALRDRVVLEYRDQKTVVLDGWLLARTEACLLALAVEHKGQAIASITRES